MRVLSLLVLSTVSLPGLGTEIALAQTVPINAVTQRETELNANSGINVGSFTLRPQVEVDVSYKSNIYALDTAKTGDEIFESGAQVSLNSNFNANSVNLLAHLENQTYFKNSSQDATTYGSRIDGSLDISGRTKLSAIAEYDHLAESRESIGSFSQSNNRVFYNQYAANLDLAQQFNELQTTAAVRFMRLTYGSVSVNGQDENLSYRNYSTVQGTGEIVYGVHNLTRFVAHATVEQRLYDYRDGNPQFSYADLIDRSADGYRIEAGLQRSVTNIIQATLRIGYMHYKYRDPRLPVAAGLSYHGDAIWNVTPLTAVTIGADRQIDEAVTPDIGGNERDQVQLGVKHELLRTLILSANLRYAFIHPVGLLPGGIDLPSRELEGGAGAHYYLTPHVMLLGSYDHSQREASSSNLVFHDDTIKFGVKLTK